MPLPLPPLDLLRDAALFLDFDGTLVDLAPEPNAVVVDAALTTLIATLLYRLYGRVAIVSGRSVAAIRGLFGDPAFAISGSHGLEIASPGKAIATAERPSALDRIVEEMKAFATAQPGVLVEEKPLGAALHYRARPAAAEPAHAFAHQLATDDCLHVQTGKMMVEIRVPGADKGTALARLMASPPFAGHLPIFLGDDDTDEPALAAATRLGGAGILIGEERPTAAAYRLPDVAATLAWLAAAADHAA